MAIVNSIATYSGEGYQLIQTIGTAVVTTGATVRVPASGSISPTVTRGLWRAKLYNETVAVTLTNLTIQASDGTNTVTIDNFVPVSALAITATAYVDVCGDFIFDTSTAGGGATGTLIFGGATFFNFVFVVAGASGAAVADCEIAAAP